MSRPPSWKDVRVYTVGHSTRTIDELVALLRAFDIAVLADIRTIPRSRRNPQFNAETLRTALHARHIRYRPVPELGGLRHPRSDSPNTGWRNSSFRGFADYMLTGEFETGLAKLHALTREGRLAVMCAEAVPWRCHRSLVADALTVRGARVHHITSASRASPHRLTSFAAVQGRRITYPAEGAGERLDTDPPFHLEATVRVLQRRPSNPVDVWDAGRYLRVLPAGRGLVLVEVRNHGTIDRPDVRLAILSGRPSPAALDRMRRILRKVLGLDVDPAPLQRLADADARLRQAALGLRGMRPPRYADLFESFASVVPFQQVSLDAGIAILNRLVTRLGAHLDHEGRRWHAFPTARAVARARIDTLRATGLSGRKAESLRRLAGIVESGELTEEQLSSTSTEDALRTLVALPGIGPWSAALILLRGLGRLDVFPPGDTGVARGLTTLMHLEPGTALGPIVERFAGYSGYLYFCSLGGNLLSRGLITPAPPGPRQLCLPGSAAAGARVHAARERDR